MSQDFAVRMWQLSKQHPLQNAAFAGHILVSHILIFLAEKKNFLYVKKKQHFLYDAYVKKIMPNMQIIYQVFIFNEEVNKKEIARDYIF